jgi:protein-S-isoprenylcysteine O-methyltransferase Ste14
MALKNELQSQGDFLFKYRSYLPIIILVAALLVYLFQDFYFTEQNKTIWELVCLDVAVFGLLIRIITIGFSGDNTSGRNTSEGQIADEVNRTGPYATVRHPLYVGNYFMWLGLAMFTQNIWFCVAFTFLYWLYYERIMYAEEMFLINKYGSDYTDWSAVTPAFIPKIGKWTKPKYKFSWRKVIRQEKAGILNLFLVCHLFVAGRQYIDSQTFLELDRHWLYFLVAAILWYVIIKVIQKTSKVLDSDRSEI